MGSFTESSGAKSELSESLRRRAGAIGSPLRLADGQTWILATPSFRADGRSLTSPPADRPLDRIFEHLALHGSVLLVDVWEAAIPLLRANYDLDDEEMADLLSVAPGEESREFVDSILDHLFGTKPAGRSYSDWVRASLWANGLEKSEISAAALSGVLAVLLVTGRTIPASRFVDACRAACARSSLETLI